ncbi:MAG: type II toxin-antitoxin system Phd/YefM family antitoxin [Patescibacteria group bacterium]
MNTVAISDLRSNLPTLIQQVSEDLKRLIVTVGGKPKAAIISLDELESLEETAEVLSFPDIIETIKKSKRQIKKGEFISIGDLKKKYCL